MENNILIICEKLKKSANEYLAELHKKLEHFNTMWNLMVEINEIENLESLCYYSAKEIIDMLKAINSSYEIDINELEASLYFYANGIETESFKKTKRFIDAEAMLKKIKESLDKFVPDNWTGLANRKKEFESDIDIYSRLVEMPLKDGKLIGEILPLQKYEILVSNGWNDEEKLELYSMLVKSHIEFLKTEQVLQFEKEEKQENKEIEEASERIAAIMSERMNDKTAKKRKIDVSKEDLELISSFIEILNKYKKALEAKKLKSQNFCDICFQFKLLLDNENASLDSIRESFTPTDFNLFLAYCLSTSIEEFEMIVDEEFEESGLENARFELEATLKVCRRYANLLKVEDEKNNIISEEIESAPENLTEENKIVFYTTGNGTSEFEKTIKSLSPEGIEDVRTLIKMLSENDINNTRVLFKGNSKKVRFLTYGNVFITFRVLFDNHILIYFVESLAEIDKKSIDIRMNAYNSEIERRINTVIKDGVISPDGTIEYRKLMERSKKIISNINVKKHDINKGGFHA